MGADKGDSRLSHAHYAAMARFRTELRRFLAFSETAAAREGLPPQQHQALLAIVGHAEHDPPSIGAIAEQLLIAPHSAAELVSRMVEAGLVVKTASPHDRRRVALAPTAKAEAVLRRLTAIHLEELQTLEPTLAAALNQLGKSSPDGGGRC